MPLYPLRPDPNRMDWAFPLFMPCGRRGILLLLVIRSCLLLNILGTAARVDPASAGQSGPVRASFQQQALSLRPIAQPSRNRPLVSCAAFVGMAGFSLISSPKNPHGENPGTQKGHVTRYINGVL